VAINLQSPEVYYQLPRVSTREIKVQMKSAPPEQLIAGFKISGAQPMNLL
jgi:hypothetical protein